MDCYTHLLSSPGEQPNSSKSADVLQPSRARAELGRVWPPTMVGDVGDEITYCLVVFDRNIGYWDGIKFLLS